MPAAPRISVFPKCWFDDFVAGTRDYLAWIREAPSLGGEGVEHYDGFLRSFDAADVDPVVAALAETGQPTSLVCFSPDFTHPDADERARQVRAAAGGDRSDAPARRPSLPHAERTALPGHDARRGHRADVRGPGALDRVRRAARRRPVHGEPLQGRHLAVPRVRPARGHLPRDHRAHRLARLRRAVRPVERHGRRLRPGRVPREGEAPRRLDARLRSLSRAGRHARRPARGGRRRRLLGAS